MNNVLKYNIINESNSDIPNYDISKKKLYIEIFLNIKKELIVIGRIDNNYICWLSITDVYDKRANSEIFKFISSNQPKTVASIYSLKDYQKIKNCFKKSIFKSQGKEWLTPFGYGYSTENTDKNGELFANDIILYFEKQQKKCKKYSDDGKYIKILNEYYSIMSRNQDPFYYWEMSEIITIIENKNYLFLAEDENLRKAYINCVDISKNLYIRYMGAVK